MANLAQMRADWGAVIPDLEAKGWPAEELQALADQVKADIAGGDAALADAWAAWLDGHRRAICARVAVLRCENCAHLHLVGGNRGQPTTASPYCGGPRDDLSPAYTPGHPLRHLPRDGGTTCTFWSAR